MGVRDVEGGIGKRKGENICSLEGDIRGLCRSDQSLSLSDWPRGVVHPCDMSLRDVCG